FHEPVQADPGENGHEDRPRERRPDPAAPDEGRDAGNPHRKRSLSGRRSSARPPPPSSSAATPRPVPFTSATGTPLALPMTSSAAAASSSATAVADARRVRP